MRLWTIWIDSDDGSAPWLESAWDDESTAANREGYERDIAKAEEAARGNGGRLRVIAVDVPDEAIFGAFKVPTVEGSVR